MEIKISGFLCSFFVVVGLLRRGRRSLRLRGGEFGNGLGTFRNGVLGEFTGKHQTDGGLDFPRGKGRLLVVGGELSCFGGDPFEDIVDEGVHDGHALLGDTRIGVDLFQHFVNVRRVRFDALLGALSTGNLLIMIIKEIWKIMGRFELESFWAKKKTQ